jgi:hypothetical protein
MSPQSVPTTVSIGKISLNLFAQNCDLLFELSKPLFEIGLEYDRDPLPLPSIDIAAAR